MSFARVGWIVAWVTIIGAAVYFLRTIFRWEWHRALVFGIVVIVVEIAMAAAWIIRRRGTEEATSPDHRDRQLRGQRHDFDWLEPPSDRFGVFIPLLLGGGMIISALAKGIERLASTSSDTSARASERPDGYGPIAFPSADLVPSDDEVRVQGLPASDDEQLRRLLGPFAVADDTRRRGS